MLTEPVKCSSCGSVSVNGGTVHCARCYAQARADAIQEYEQLLRNAYEVYAGMEGVPEPETAVEAYLLKIIKDMVEEISQGLAAIKGVKK